MRQGNYDPAVCDRISAISIIRTGRGPRARKAWPWPGLLLGHANSGGVRLTPIGPLHDADRRAKH